MALSAARIVPNMELIIESNSESNERLGYDLTKRLITSGVEFSAIFASSDHMAIGAIKALRESKLNVPREKSVVGFDGIESSAYTRPPLTTIYQPAYEKGYEAGHTLIQSLRGELSSVRRTILPSKLIIRESTSRYKGGG
jgi:LacI family transcriptional regulator